MTRATVDRLGPEEAFHAGRAHAGQCRGGSALGREAMTFPPKPEASAKYETLAANPLSVMPDRQKQNRSHKPISGGFFSYKALSAHPLE